VLINQFKLIIWANSFNYFKLNSKRLPSQATVNRAQFDIGVNAQSRLRRPLKIELQANRAQLNVPAHLQLTLMSRPCYLQFNINIKALLQFNVNVKALLYFNLNVKALLHFNVNVEA